MQWQRVADYLSYWKQYSYLFSNNKALNASIDEVNKQIKLCKE
jgi:hypothetical protein